MPHADFAGLAQAVTFRLADALPDEAVQRIRASLLLEQRPDVAGQRADALLAARVHDWLDAGHGTCCLRSSEICGLVLAELRSGHGAAYRLDAAVVMPNHVHVLLRSAGEPLGMIIGRWKGRTARAINQRLGQSGALWQREYFDRFIRDEEHHIAAVRYVVQNPVQARLVVDPWAWPGLWVDPAWRGCVEGSAG